MAKGLSIAIIIVATTIYIVRGIMEFHVSYL